MQPELNGNSSRLHSATVLVLYIFSLVLIVVGGVCFHYIESPTEVTLRMEYYNKLMAFIDNNTCVDKEELRDIVQTVIKAQEKGYAEFTGTNKTSSNWDFVSAIFFCTTLVTTVGYGITPPATIGGRVFTVFWALLGIPVFMICTAQVGMRISGSFEILKNKVTSLAKSPFLQRIVGPFFITLFGLVVFMLLPAVLFWQVEGWEYGEALYYTVVTLLTIGFGDYVPKLANKANEEAVLEKSIYRLFVCLWIMVGLIWMATVISSLQTAVSRTSQKLDSKLLEFTFVNNSSRSGIVDDSHSLEGTRDGKDGADSEQSKSERL